MTMRTGLARSKNMISIRVLQAVGPKSGQEWVSRFGFDADRHPPFLTMALGAGSVTPLQLAAGYSVFANGGYRVNPWIISKVTDHKGRVISETTPPIPSDQPRAIDARNAFVMNSLLQEVTRSGTAARAQGTLKRPDLYGKTGTTNDSWDAWFAGFQPTIAAVTWIGYDTPRNLGNRETGGGLSLPVWISFMQQALKGVPVMEAPVPPGVVNVGGEWFYDEYARNAGAAGLGAEEHSAPALVRPSSPPPAEERNRILDLFRN
jgi:penicillin-binding protein 1A